MKKLLIILLLALCSNINAQEEDKVIITNASVLNDDSSSSLILSRNFGKTFQVPTSGVDMDGIPYQLIKEREYRFVLEVNIALKEEKHCSGCTGILPAKVLKVNTSSRQNSVDITRMYQVEKEAQE